MSKQVIIVHGWSSHPKDCWFPWLKQKLEERGYKVIVPAMPDTDEPKIKAWVKHLKEVVGQVDEQTFFVGHSIGCQAIIRYLEGLPVDAKVGGVVFVGGWFKLTNLSGPEEWAIAEPWLENNIDYNKVKSHTKNLVAIFSDNDHWVPLENKKLFAERLGAKTIVEHEKEHFTSEGGVLELPVVLEVLQNFSRV